VLIGELQVFLGSGRSDGAYDHIGQFVIHAADQDMDLGQFPAGRLQGFRRLVLFGDGHIDRMPLRAGVTGIDLVRAPQAACRSLQAGDFQDFGFFAVDHQPFAARGGGRGMRRNECQAGKHDEGN
jgi:hypothetical protein